MANHCQQFCCVLAVFFRLAAFTGAEVCDDVGTRTNCSGSSAEECAMNGCCWKEQEGQPSCFFQTPKYKVKSIDKVAFGHKMTIGIDDESGSGKFPGSPISPLQVDVIQETGHRLHMRVTDPLNKRWEIPESILPTPLPQNTSRNLLYGYQLPAVGEEFFFKLNRLGSSVPLFDTSSSTFIYANQLLQIGTVLPYSNSIYGFGEHKTRLKLNDGSNYSLTLWNFDGATPDHLNLYGSHPFYLDLNSDGSAHGVFLRNSNGMDIHFTPTSITYNVIGGVLDFYFFLGPEPGEVVTQYQEVIGRPAMPPYWALGFHQCRYGFKNLQEVKDVVNNFATNEIPLDTMWTDIDYMNKYKDFSNDPTNFPVMSMTPFIQELHANGQHYVVIIDPGISTDEDYLPYLAGLKADAYIRDYNGDYFIGKVWPGETVFPDFAYSMTVDYWHGQIAAWVSEVPVDGLWIDMNEPSNFCNGACNRTSLPRAVGSNFDPVHPPYSIGNRKSRGGTMFVLLNDKTLDMDAVHHNGATAYDMHNLYGFTESIATRSALISIYGKRPFVLSRSTFPGSGAHAAHWLGDNMATSVDLLLSISTILSFQLFGVPLVGADICGFIGPTSEELCARWMEVGSFYPFARNHNNKGSPSQEPYQWASVAAISRKYLAIRYSLLPYYYTLFYQANHSSSVNDFQPSYGMVLHPLFIHFPTDATACGIDSQFMVGGALLIAPQCNIGDKGKFLDVYLPQAVWYDWFTLDYVLDGESPMSISNLPTPLDHVPIYIRGGHIIPMQGPGLTTTESRKNPYSLMVAPDNYGRAAGSLYLDDGESLVTTQFTLIKYFCAGSQLTSAVSGTKYASQAGLPQLRNVTVLGLKFEPTSVTLDGVPTNFTFTEVGKYSFVGKIVVENLSIDMDKEFRLNWM